MQLLERELYLDVLDSVFGRASSGAGCVVLVSGEAGIGKTALIQHRVARHRTTVRGRPVDTGPQMFPGKISAAPKAATTSDRRPNGTVEWGRCRKAHAASAIKLPPGSSSAIAV